MGKIKTLLDVDGVILNSHAYFLDQVNSTYANCIAEQLGRPLNLEDISSWSFGLARDITKIPIIKKRDDDLLGALDYLHGAYAQTEYKIPLVDPSVARVVNYIIKHFNVEIVTANYNSEGLKKVLESHGISTQKFRQDVKKDISEYNNVIEDNPTVNINGSQTLLLRDRPWNRKLEGQNILRFDNSLQLPGILRMLEKYGNLQNIYNILSSEKIDFKGESSIEVYGFKLLKQKI